MNKASFSLVVGLFLSLSAHADLKPLDPRDLTLITDPKIIEPLEARGYSFGKMIEGAQSNLISTQDLTENSSFATIQTTLANDLEGMRKSDSHLGIGMSYDHRLFDYSWLKSENAKFVLVGVVSRLDRQFANPGTCGEVRLVYRLAYDVTSRGQDVASRLPMTLNVVFRAYPENGSCASVAKRWILPSNLSDSSQILNYLLSLQGPFANSAFSPRNLKQVEVNLQSVRWPATERSDFGGYGNYHLRVFKYNSGDKSLTPVALENQPDIDRIRNNSKLKQDLLQWIGQNLKQIDQGTAVLPDEFLDTTGRSVTPGGFERAENRAYEGLFKAKDFANLPMGALRRIKSPAALLRRLDDMTCSGCHQARSVAGFHLMGKDAENKYIANAVLVPASAHLIGEIPRRRAVIQAMAAGTTPDFSRPFAERADPALNLPGNGYGEHCQLGSDPSFNSWSCAQGLKCHAIVTSDFDNGVGQCMPVAPQIGDPCETGKVQEGTNFASDERIAGPNTSCGNNPSLYCIKQSGGFPGGMCGMANCKSVPVNGACGTLPTGHPGFNQCLGEGKNFVECINEFASPRGLRSCDAFNPCRDDYICTQADPKVEQGTCVPPYFLFQFRVDAHPIGRSDARTL